MDNVNSTEKSNRSILVVDDVRSNIMFLCNILRPGYTILTATSGRAAIDVARAARPDLVLLDIVMPDMSGFEVLSEMKRDDALKGIPVILITAMDNEEDEKVGFALGAADYIKKPLCETVVRARIDAHLSASCTPSI